MKAIFRCFAVMIFSAVMLGASLKTNAASPLEVLGAACHQTLLGKRFSDQIRMAYESRDPESLAGKAATLDFMLGLKAYLGPDVATREMSGRFAAWSERNTTGFSVWYESALNIFLNLNIKRGQKLVDFGSSFGRFIMIGGILFPEATFEGYEIVPERVEQSRKAIARLELSNVKNHEQDLSDPDFEVPYADYYYFYDSLNHLTFSQILDKILKVNSSALIIIESGSFEDLHVIAADPRFRQVREIRHNNVMTANFFRVRDP